ncbi:3'-5' exonuclease [Algibacillus agarilyticus]|uniref:3'-5' exonuclease n=1 Tax=Algibacillus agarilyticus TaxID=2234133 RepID=UPI000DD08DC2|nr:3'-5' exonuclease [Algibacillus agarilyticus]
MLPQADSLIILDFETTGLSPNLGDRAIEIGAVKIESGQVVDTFQELMDPGFLISSFIQGYTGITNSMLKGSRSCSTVMYEFADFIRGSNLVAHNASFDKRFLEHELELVSSPHTGGEFACSLLLARRIYPNAPSHKLGELITYKNIPAKDGFHRALFDAEMTAKLWLKMIEDIKIEYQLAEVPFKLIMRICKAPKGSIGKVIEKWIRVHVNG